MQKNRSQSDIILKIPYHQSTRDKTWVTVEQIDEEHWYFITKITEILWWGNYSEKSKMFARSILDFLVNHRFVTWKQFDSVMGITEQRKPSFSSKRNIIYTSDINTKDISKLMFGYYLTKGNGGCWLGEPGFWNWFDENDLDLGDLQ